MDTSERQIKRIVLERMDRCSVCHRPYVTEDVHVISRKPEMWMMVVQCTDCQARNFVAAVLNDGDAEAAQLALRTLSSGSSALTPAAEPPPEERTPVTSDDIIDMHEFLQSFDGDFRALFGLSGR